MTAYDGSALIGPRNVRPTAAQLATIADFDPGLFGGGVGLDNLLRHLHYFQIPLRIETAINANTKSSIAMLTRVPFKIVAMEVGVESAAGTTCTGDVEKAPAATPTVFATMSTGAVDVETGAGIMQNLPVLSGHEDVAQGDRLRCTFVAAGAGAVVGACAVLHAFRN